MDAYIFNAKEGITTISPEGEIYVYSNIESFFFPEISVDGIWAWGDDFPLTHDYWRRKVTGLWVGYLEGEHIQVFENEIERAGRGYKLLYDYYSKIKKRKKV